MIFKTVSGTTTKWFIDVLEAKPGSLHSPIYVGIRKDGDEKQIFLDSLTQLVDLLVREFDQENGLNFIGIPPLTTKRAVKTIADYFNLGDDFCSDLEYDYLRFIEEEGLPGPSLMITAREIKELYERSAQLKSKLHAPKATTDEVLEEAMEHLESEDETTQDD